MCCEVISSFVIFAVLVLQFCCSLPYKMLQTKVFSLIIIRRQCLSFIVTVNAVKTFVAIQLTGIKMGSHQQQQPEDVERNCAHHYSAMMSRPPVGRSQLMSQCLSVRGMGTTHFSDAVDCTEAYTRSDSSSESHQ